MTETDLPASDGWTAVLATVQRSLPLRILVLRLRSAPITCSSMSTDEALHVVVRHRNDVDQRWANEWQDDDSLLAITTSTELGELLDAAQTHDRTVFVHRCGCGASEPRISCSVSVVRVAPIDRRSTFVRFQPVEVLDFLPPKSPMKGQNWYFATRPPHVR